MAAPAPRMHGHDRTIREESHSAQKVLCLFPNQLVDSHRTAEGLHRKTDTDGLSIAITLMDLREIRPMRGSESDIGNSDAFQLSTKILLAWGNPCDDRIAGCELRSQLLRPVRRRRPQ